MVDEIVWDDDVESVAEDMMNTNAPAIIIIKNNNTFFMIQISPFLDNSCRISIVHGIDHQYLSHEIIKSGEALLQCTTPNVTELWSAAISGSHKTKMQSCHAIPGSCLACGMIVPNKKWYIFWILDLLIRSNYPWDRRLGNIPYFPGYLRCWNNPSWPSFMLWHRFVTDPNQVQADPHRYEDCHRIVHEHIGTVIGGLEK